jgi:hypothetical protein
MRRTGLAIGFVCLFAAPSAAGPADDLLTHVPPGTSVCIVVRDLGGHVNRIADSPFAKWLEKSPLGKKLRTALELHKPDEVEKQLKDQFGLTPEQLMADVFGDAIVFAYTPGKNGREDRALILIKPRVPETAGKFLLRLDELQLKAGELSSVKIVPHKSGPYTTRNKADGTTEAYRLKDGVLAFASDVTSLGYYLATHSEPGQALHHPVRLSLAQLKTHQSFATLWLNPRDFDAAFAEKGKNATPGDRAAAEVVAGVWKAVDDFAIHLDLTDVVTLRASARLNEKNLPASVGGLAPMRPGQTPLWQAIPPDAIVAVAGRFAVASALAKVDGLAKAAGEPLPSVSLAKDVGPLVGRDKLPAVLEALGPDWGLWLNAPAKSEAWVPEWTLAIKVSGTSESAKALLDGADAAAQLARLAYNAAHDDPLALSDVTVDGVRVRTLAGPGLPAGVRPSFTIKDGYFLLTSSPERIAAFKAPAGDFGTVTDASLVRVSATGLRAYLAKHAPALAKPIANAQKRDAGDVKEDLTALTELLEPFDKAELRASQEAGVTRLSLVLTPTKPLQK